MDGKRDRIIAIFFLLDILFMLHQVLTENR